MYIVQYTPLHRKADKFGLVEIFRYFPGLDGVDSADSNEQDIERLTNQEGRVFHATFQNGLIALRVSRPRPRWLHPHPQNGSTHLVTSKNERD